MSKEKSLQGLKAEDTKRYPACGSRDIVMRDSESYCEKCGFVIDE